MKKLLIIGASILQLPAIQKAKELGFYVGVIDYNPEAIGIKYADVFFNISTIDTVGILKTARSFNPNGIMTLATDMPMRAIAVTTQELGLPGITLDTAIKSTDKAEMIRAFKENSVECPWFYVANNILEFTEIKKKLVFPCIFKPTDNSGSRGVIVVHHLSELDDAYNYSRHNSRGGAVIIEEFLTGDEVSVEVMAVQGKVHILAITDKITTGAPYFVEMGHSQPSKLPATDLLKIKDLTVRAVKAVGIETGPAHVEIMLTKDGPKMIELGARMGGDCITSHLVPLSTGIDMIKATIELSMGQIPDLSPKFQKGNAIRYFNSTPGRIFKISGVEEAYKLEGIKEIVFTKKLGDTVTQIQSSTDRVGYVVAQNVGAGEAITTCEKAISEIKLLIKC
jgi:biotin carboxylase